MAVSESGNRLYICPDTLVKEYNEGKTLRELGDEYGVTPPAIRYHIVKTRLPHRRKWGNNSKIGITDNGNSLWKGNEVGLTALHEWVGKRKPKPEVCEECGANKPFDLASIENRYTRNPNDWEWLCRSCHMNKDGRIKNLKRGVV